MASTCRVSTQWQSFGCCRHRIGSMPPHHMDNVRRQSSFFRAHQAAAIVIVANNPNPTSERRPEANTELRTSTMPRVDGRQHRSISRPHARTANHNELRKSKAFVKCQRCVRHAFTTTVNSTQAASRAAKQGRVRACVRDAAALKQTRAAEATERVCARRKAPRANKKDEDRYLSL
jgi:hypothetical protein